MLLPGLLGTGSLKLLKVSQLGVKLIHPVGLSLDGRKVIGDS